LAGFIFTVLQALIRWVSIAWARDTVAVDFANLAVRAVDGNFADIEWHASALDGRVAHVTESALFSTSQQWVHISIGIARLKDKVLGQNEQTEQGESKDHCVQNVSVGANSET